jgi:hypothetical protein
VNAVVLLACLMPADPDPPVVGRPADWPFTGASARFVRSGYEYLAPFTASASISQTRVEMGQPLTLTVTMEARGPVLRSPERIDLREVLALKMTFHIEDAPDPSEGRTAGKWRWAWRLRPRGPWVREVPGVPLVYYNPDLLPEEKGYQLLWTDSVPITVEPPEVVAPPPDLPPEAREPAGVEALSSRPWPVPGWGAFLIALILPPAACVAWYWAWCRLYPDAARVALLRQGKAARRARAALARLPREGRTEAMVQALTAYLHDRFALAVASPTPDEAAAAVPEPVRERLADFWRRADAARFGDGPCPDAAEAERLITDIEGHTCPPS